MKKIITVLFAVLAMSSMFAYMPNKKNVEKYGEWITYTYKYKDIHGRKKTSYITYNTKTGEIYFQHYEFLEAIKKYSPNLQSPLIKNKEKMWSDADLAKESYRIFTDKEIEKYFLDDYPFFTEENWQTLTKEEWNKMAKDFLENN